MPNHGIEIYPDEFSEEHIQLAHLRQFLECIAQTIAITIPQGEQQDDFLALLCEAIRRDIANYAPHFPYRNEFKEMYHSFEVKIRPPHTEI